MMRQAWMRNSWRPWSLRSVKPPMKPCFLAWSSILSLAVLSAMFVFAIGADADAGIQFDSPLTLSESLPDGPADLADGLLLPLFTDSSEATRQIRQQPAPKISTEMLTRPSETVDSALPIPEPSSLALLGGLGGMLMLIHRMRAYFDHNVTV